MPLGNIQPTLVLSQEQQQQQQTQQQQTQQQLPTLECSGVESDWESLGLYESLGFCSFSEWEEVAEGMKQKEEEEKEEEEEEEINVVD